MGGTIFRRGAPASYCGGSSLGVQALGVQASVAAVQGLTGCGSRALDSVESKHCLSLGMEAYQAPLYMGFTRQEYWSGVPLPSPTRIV